MSGHARSVARAIVLASLAGPWSQASVHARLLHALTLKSAAADKLVRLLFRLFREPPLGREERVAKLLLRSHTLRELLDQRPPVRVQHWLWPEPSMAEPHPSLAGLALPQLRNEAELATFLGIMADELDWFADPHRLNRGHVAEPLRHYSYRWVAKRSGSYRLIEAPKPRMKRMQRRVLDDILSQIPLHDACHGQRRGRGVRTFVAPHAGQPLLIAFDLAEFFSVVREARVRGIFASIGYNDRIARLLAGLCCAPTPGDVLRRQPRPREPRTGELERAFFQRQTLRDSHLPQGAPSSPALANLAAYVLDVRLAALAQRYGAAYTRYADDLAFSGSAALQPALDRLIPTVGAIAYEEGFALRYDKTRVMRASVRQQLCGVVVNTSPSVSRSVLARLEATLVNCRRDGPQSQNRDGHADFRAYLAGQVAWVAHLHADKGKRLAALLAEIDWPGAQS
jgi:hypothetical protein